MENLPKLSYSMTMKQKKIIRHKQSLNLYTKLLYISLLLFVVCFLYIMKNSRHFTIMLADSGGLFPLLKPLDLWVFTLAITVAICVYSLSILYNKKKKKYDDLRHDIIEDLEKHNDSARLCTCDDCCTCKDDFIKSMEEYDIDLVIK